MEDNNINHLLGALDSFGSVDISLLDKQIDDLQKQIGTIQVRYEQLQKLRDVARRVQGKPLARSQWEPGQKIRIATPNCNEQRGRGRSTTLLLPCLQALAAGPLHMLEIKELVGCNNHSSVTTILRKFPQYFYKTGELNTSPYELTEEGFRKLEELEDLVESRQEASSTEKQLA
jgi:hypothetical protein